MSWSSTLRLRARAREHCNTHTAAYCNPLQHTATHCNTLQHTTTHCNTSRVRAVKTSWSAARGACARVHANAATHMCVAVRCSVCVAVPHATNARMCARTLQHTYCNTHTALHILQHTATHCNTHCNTPQVRVVKTSQSVALRLRACVRAPGSGALW